MRALVAKLQALAGVMVVFLFSSQELPWNGHILATDACETGWGVCRAGQRLGSRRGTWNELPVSPDASRRVRRSWLRIQVSKGPASNATVRSSIHTR